jgi:hypothetical protein
LQYNTFHKRKKNKNNLTQFIHQTHFYKEPNAFIRQPNGFWDIRNSIDLYSLRCHIILVFDRDHFDGISL